jgi:hypothetical protein
LRRFGRLIGGFKITLLTLAKRRIISERGNFARGTVKRRILTFLTKLLIALVADLICLIFIKT